MEIFVKWYNTEHLHSGIYFVTPVSKHLGLDIELLKNRNEVYTKAKAENQLYKTSTSVLIKHDNYPKIFHRYFIE